jgi:hypothetical protein
VEFGVFEDLTEILFFAVLTRIGELREMHQSFRKWVPADSVPVSRFTPKPEFGATKRNLF